MKKLLLLSLALTMLLSLSACVWQEDAETDPFGETESTKATWECSWPTDPPSSTPNTPFAGDLHINWEPGTTYDPMKSSGWGDYIWMQNVFENILYRDADGNLAPGVCNFDLSEDALTLKLWVRDGIQFHNGDLVDIYDVQASFLRACANVTRMKEHVLPYLAGTEVKDDKILTVTFSAYDPATLYWFAANQPWNVVLPKEICEKYGDGPITIAEDVLGTGPYCMDLSSAPGVRYLLVRNDRNIPNDDGHRGLAAPKMGYMDTITVSAYADEQTMLADMIAGEKTVQSFYDPELASQYRQIPGFRTYPDREASLLYLAFNCVNPEVACYNADLRKAVAAALDYEEIMLHITGDMAYETNYSPIPEEDHGYYCNHYAYADYHGTANAELAKRYLERGNYDGREVVFLLEHTSEIYPIFEQRLKAAGINITVQYVEANALEAVITDPENNRFDFVLRQSPAGDYIPAMLDPDILTSFYDGVDDAIAENRQLVVGSEKSLKAWEKADRKLAEDCPCAIFGTRSAKMIVNNDLNWMCDGPWRYWYNAFIYGWGSCG